MVGPPTLGSAAQPRLTDYRSERIVDSFKSIALGEKLGMEDPSRLRNLGRVKLLDAPSPGSCVEKRNAPYAAVQPMTYFLLEATAFFSLS